MKNRDLSLLSLIISICLMQSARGETLTESLRLGMARSPSLQYSLSQISGSDSTINQARSGWLPSISLSAGKQAVGNSSSDGDNQYAVSLQQNLFDFGRTGDRVDNAKFSKGKEIWKAIDDAETLSAKIAESYFNIQKGQKLLSNNQAELTEHRRIYEVALARANGGMDNLGDARQVEVRIKGLEASAENIKAQLASAINEYEILVGKTPGVLEPVDLTFLHQEITEDLRGQIRTSPQIRALEMEHAAASSQYQYLRKNWLPQLSLSVSQGKTSVYSENDTQVMLNVTSNIFDGGNSYFQAQGAAHQVESARWNVQKTIDDNATSISQQFQEALGFKQESIIYAARTEQASQVMSLYNDQYRVNRRSVIDLLNAAQDYFQTIDNQINSLANYNISLIRTIAKLGKINKAFNIETNIPGDDEIEASLDKHPIVAGNNHESTKITLPDNSRQMNYSAEKSSASPVIVAEETTTALPVSAPTPSTATVSSVKETQQSRAPGTGTGTGTGTRVIQDSAHTPVQNTQPVVEDIPDPLALIMQ